MSVTIKRDGYGYLEPNKLSAGRTGQVMAEMDCAEGIDVLENGTFIKYDMAKGVCSFDGVGPWYLVFNEEKLYDERKQMHKHFALKREDAYDGKLVPRVFYPVVGDVFTTNAITEGDYAAGDVLGVDAKTGRLKADAEGFVQVAAETILPDGQKAVKLQVIKAQ